MRPSLYKSLRSIVWAYRNCDDKEWFICQNCDWKTDDTWGEDDFKICPVCGGENISLRLDRKMMLHLAYGDLKRSIFPYRLYHWDPHGDTNTCAWYFRRWQLFDYQVPNTMKLPVTSDGEEENP